MFIFFICLLITISLHELGHMLVALKCGAGVTAFSIGFGKPYLHFKYKGIDFRISPLLFGGYCDIKGMDSKKEKDDFLAQRYSKKLAILLAGVVINFLIACICYWINYGDILFGLKVDMLIGQAMLTRDYTKVAMIYIGVEPNLFLAQLSLINIFCAITNILPLPALDGGHVWLVAMEKVWKENFIKYYTRISNIGFVLLMVLQVWFLYWVFFIQ